jgi:hypothetical protein
MKYGSDNGLSARHAALLFEAVVETYVKAKLTHPLSASNPDPDAVRPFRWTHALAEYIADVQNATETALRDSPTEQDIWHQLALRAAAEMGATGLPEPGIIYAKHARDVAKKCASVYHARHLEPKQYFRHIKQRAEDSK